MHPMRNGLPAMIGLFLLVCVVFIICLAINPDFLEEAFRAGNATE